jgi:hypothetical protein
MSSTEKPAAKRPKTERKSLKDCPAHEFLKCLATPHLRPTLLTGYRLTRELYSGPEVIVQAKGKVFEVPKALLVYSSGFFEAALGGQCKESADQKIELEMATAEDFELVIQWSKCLEI